MKGYSDFGYGNMMFMAQKAQHPRLTRECFDQAFVHAMQKAAEEHQRAKGLTDQFSFNGFLSDAVLELCEA